MPFHRTLNHDVYEHVEKIQPILTARFRVPPRSLFDSKSHSKLSARDGRRKDCRPTVQVCSQRMRFFGGGGLRPPPELLHHTGKAAVVHLSRRRGDGRQTRRSRRRHSHTRTYMYLVRHEQQQVGVSRTQPQQQRNR